MIFKQPFVPVGKEKRETARSLPFLSNFRFLPKNATQCLSPGLFYLESKPGRGGGGGFVGLLGAICWVCATGVLDPLPHHSLFCGQL